MPLGYNQVLGEMAKPEAMRPHRVGLASWPTSREEARTRSLEALLAHTAGSGYEGTEWSPVTVSRYFPGDSPPVMARKARRAIERSGLVNFGSALHFQDGMLRQNGWQQTVIDQFKLTQDMGGEYATVQFFLLEDYLNTGGAYREDEAYLRWCADRVTAMRGAAWEMGLNFYLEVHIDRITEDPAACCRILELASCELNGDLSHLLYRGITRGQYAQKILKHVNHTHVRLARVHGDLSAAADDPAADWANGGVTWQIFELMKPVLATGLSSRAILGETGMMHLVTDTLTQDAALVPLYRAMARFADAGAQGIAIKVNNPEDLKPWG